MVFKSALLYILMFGMGLYAEAFSSVFDLKVKFGFTLDESHTLVTEAPMSFEQCHDACLARKKCLAIEFRRLFRLCRLLSSDSNTAGVQFVFQKGIVYSEKSDWTKKYPKIGCKDCNAEETCLTNDNTVNCKLSECAKPELLDQQSMILGSELSVGSKILHKCKYMTNVSAESVCKPNGHWSKQDFECPLDIDGKKFKIISSQNNKWWHYNGNGDKLVSSRYQPNDDFVKFYFLKQTGGFYKIMCFAYAHYISDGFGLGYISPLMPVLQYITTTQDGDSMLYNVTMESENYYRIQTKATGHYVRLDSDNYVSSRYNLMDESSLFLFEEVP